VSCGAKHSLYNACQALLNPEDEVIIPAPYWVSYPDIVTLAGATPVIVSTGLDTRYTLTPEQLTAAITNKTRLLILNSPSNPTGTSYSESALVALAEVLENHPQIMLLSDDIYEHIRWGSLPFCNILMACPALYDRTIVVNGVSKCYAMTGWRIGYAAGPAELIRGMRSLQSQSTSNPNAMAQVAAEAALTGNQSCVQTMVHAFKERHDFVVATLNNIPGVHCLLGDGTFYAFPNVEVAMANLKLSSDVALADYLLETAHLAVVPGSAFGMPGHIRLSFATSLEQLTEALDRLKKALSLSGD